MISQGMKDQIAEAASQLDRENDFGYAIWQWPDSRFEAIEALAMNDEAIQRSAEAWDALYFAAIEAGDGDLADKLLIAQRLLEM